MRRRTELFDVINGFLLLILNLLVLYPFVYTISVSLSSADAVLTSKVWLLPVELTGMAYKTLLGGTTLIYRAYANTIFYSLTGTAVALLLTSMTAYPLSRKFFCGKKVITIYFAVTMFFGGGIIPLYLLIRGIGIYNTVWALALPGAVTAWNLIIIRTNFQSQPYSLSESAFMDGASHWTILTRIVLPLARPILATIGLFTIVRHWNEFFAPLLYIDSPSRWPLPVVLRNIIAEQFTSGFSDLENAIDASVTEELIRGGFSMTGYKEMLKSAAIIVSIGPIILVYPFIQRFFVRGILIGSIKG